MKLRRLCAGFTAGMVCGGISLALWALAEALPAQKATPEKADSILILKKDHLMELLAGGKVIRGYKVALGQGGLTPKVREGTGARRRGTTSSKKSTSAIHKALHISFQRRGPQTRGEAGRFSGQVHFDSRLPNGKAYIGRRTGFTIGRWAASPVTDEEIDEIWNWFRWVRPVEIRP